VNRFLATRSNQGQRAAIEAVLSSANDAASFGRGAVPYIKGLTTADGLPLSTVNRAAKLYGGDIGPNLPLGGAL